MTYDPRQSFAAQQLAYSRAAGTQTSKQQGLSKGRGTPISKSRSLGAFEPDPAQRNTTTRSTYTPPTRRNTKKNKGSTYDEVPQVLTQGIVQRPKPKSTKETGYERVKRIFDNAMSGFGDFEVPTQPTFDTVKPQNLYKDKRYFGPQVYVPDTSQFKGDQDLKELSPPFIRDYFRFTKREGDFVNSLTLPDDVDNPAINMFGVRRRYTRNPDALMAPPSVKMPAKLDPISRALSLAFLPPSMPTTAEYTVSEGESLLTVLDTLNAGKPNSQKVTLEEIGNLNNIPDVVANPFGKIKKGDVLQVPIKKQTAVGDLRDQIEKERSVKRAIIEFERLPESEKKNIRERYRLRKEAQPASYTEEENKILKELEGLDPDVANYVREFYDNQSEERLQKLAEEVGVDITDKNKTTTSLANELSNFTKKLKYTTGEKALGDKDRSTYKVKSGDTMYDIAKREGVTLDKLLEANPDVDADKIGVGQVINIPRGANLDELSSGLKEEIIKQEPKTEKDLNVAIFNGVIKDGTFPTPKVGDDPLTWIAQNTFGLNENDPEFRKAFRAITKVDPYMTPWCAAFVGHVLRNVGVDLPSRAIQNPNMAFNYINLGDEVYDHNPTTNKTYAGKLSDVKTGDVVVFNNANRDNKGNIMFGKGHVSFVVDVLDDGTIIATGGNQAGGTQVATTAYTPAVIKKHYKGGYTVRRITTNSLEGTDPSIIAAITKEISIGGAEQ